MKRALTVDEQIKKLKKRGMLFEDEKEAEKILLNISYYRLGFYSFPFEKSFPKKSNRDHKFKNGTTFDDVVELYQFDSELRWLLLYFLNIVEVGVRTHITYFVSNQYVKDPTWFVNPNIMSDNYVKKFNSKVYSNMGEIKVLMHHHKKYRKDEYAPAWKTLEFMTLGNILKLYLAITDKTLQTEIANHFGCSLDTFCNYLNVIKELRNNCAHGTCLYDMHLDTRIKLQPANIDPNNCYNISGAISVVIYMLKHTSNNKATELYLKIHELLNNRFGWKTIQVIRTCSGILKQIEIK